MESLGRRSESASPSEPEQGRGRATLTMWRLVTRFLPTPLLLGSKGEPSSRAVCSKIDDVADVRRTVAARLAVNKLKVARHQGLPASEFRVLRRPVSVRYR